MPNYTFNCEKCGVFTEWHTSSKGNKQYSACPSCKMKSKRVFAPPIVYKVDARVKQIESGGKTPKVMKRDQLPKRLKKSPVSTRPWQV
ncbi:zinc ribbon domain-containing protein [Paraliobacillus sp. JSM ZJ581]|uniref:zinc ribbon domain-containing protein n=1 Tax=Paraliobacillus sp. JSM ZJ581 TaxID=3342118 RepID=UPI0035A91BD9